MPGLEPLSSNRLRSSPVSWTLFLSLFHLASISKPSILSAVLKPCNKVWIFDRKGSDLRRQCTKVEESISSREDRVSLKICFISLTNTSQDCRSKKSGLPELLYASVKCLKNSADFPPFSGPGNLSLSDFFSNTDCRW